MALSIDLTSNRDRGGPQNKIGVFESMLSGVASGLIGIPKGFFSLGASIMDLGVNSGKAAAVEAWFDDLTEFDEKAEATAAGKITELLINIGIPGGVAFKGASNLAKTSMLAAKNKKYVRLAEPGLVKGAKKAAELTAKGKTKQFMAGALGGGLAEGVFVGDVEGAGSFGDLLGGPTAIDRSSTDPDATKEILNRIRFGTEGALFTGILSGTGKVIKKITNRNKGLDTANSQLDRWIDKVASKFRSRSGKTQEFFDLERKSIGAQAGDASAARNLSRDLDIDVDKLFPPMRTVFNKASAKERTKFLGDVHDTLLSGEARLAEDGVATFGEMDKVLINRVRDQIKKFAPSADKAAELEKSIIGGLSVMRSKWSNLFTKLGGSLDSADIKTFQNLFGGKFKNYLGSTYDIFQDRSILPWLRYKPAAQAIENAKDLFKSSARQSGKEITDLEAEQIVNNVLKTSGLPKGLRMDKPSDAIFNIPDFFVNRTALDDAVKRGGIARISIKDLDSAADRKVFDELFGKQKNPMQTMIGGMAKLSLITRRNLFYDDILKKNDEVIANWTAAVDKRSVPQPMFAKSEAEARAFFGDDFVRMDPVDPAQTLNVNIASQASNPFGDATKPYFARQGVADAMMKTSGVVESSGTLGRIYESFVLYPKATSQIAKTILSPVTHLRNFVSAGAFASANGILPLADPKAIKQAYQALQTPLKGTRQQNELYEELLELGVVNSNVSLGDLSRLLKDVNFGESMTSDKGMRLLLKPLSKLKSVSQDLYTAEDDFWKIYSWAVEKDRLEKQFAKAGLVRGQFFKRNGVDIKLDDKFLKEEAADIVRNNIPNYDYVSDFVQGLRKLPVGNFVSFPAEIARTGTNIVRRALREINEEITLANGTVVKPMQTIGYTRLFGFTTTVAAIPMATTAAFQALYDVTDEEREAIRRFAAKWSKNSTLLPIKDKETGDFKYVDFSHANAYDTLIRPLQTMVNAVQDGRTDQDGMMDDFAKGLFTSMSEFAQPFISEAIWTEAALDILARGGRTRDGFEVYSDQDNAGDKNSKIFAHLVKAQMPFSLNQLQRLDRSIESVDVITKGKYDKYGQEFEFGDEFGGLFGFRAVSVNPGRTMNFKVAEFQQGIRESRSLFTRATLKGGPIEGREIVDAYLNANRAMFNVKKNLKKDIEAAELLNIGEPLLRDSLSRVSALEANSIRDGKFRPYAISLDVQRSFAENAAAIGEANPLREALPIINDLRNELSRLSLDLPELPTLENPLMPIMQDTPLTPTSLNLPSVDSGALQNKVNGGQFSSLSNQQKFNILFPNG